MQRRWEVEHARLEERVRGLDRLTDEKFVKFSTMMEAQAAKVALALDASKEAILKAEHSTERRIDATAADVRQRFESVNEFRAALTDSQSKNVTRLEFDQFRAYYTEQHALLRDRYAVEVADLKGRLDTAEGRQGGIQNVWGVIVAVVMAAIAIGALVFRNM